MRKLLFSLLLLAPCAWATTPQISSITVTAQTNELDVVYYSSPDAYCWVLYGTSTANYQWASSTYLSGNGGTFTDHLCSMIINGLKAGTTYYLLPTARPDADDEVNICSTTVCGTRELSSATLPSGTSVLPAAPVPVASQMLLEPNTSNYAFVTLIATNTNAECFSSTTVSAPSGYSWTINANEKLSAIIAAGAMTPGTVFELPQGSTCTVPEVDIFGHGYLLPGDAPDPLSSGYDDPNHRWIIFRTSSGSAADFPPFGKRTGLSFFSHYATFISTNPDFSETGSGGSIFGMPASGNGSAYPVNHIWIENLKFAVDETQTGSYWDYLFFFANPQGGGGGTGLFPEYVVFRDNYMHYPYRANQETGTPAIQGILQGTGSKQIAYVGNYSDNANYGASNIEQGIEFTDSGFKGSTGTPSEVLVDNNMFSGMAMNIYAEVNNHFNPSPADYTVTHNTLYWPLSTLAYAQEVGYGACRNQAEWKGSERLLFKGNFINGQWSCENTGVTILLSGSPVDDMIQSNYLVNVAQPFATTGTGSESGSVGYYTGGNREIFTNNVAYAVGRSTWQAGGGGLIMAIMELDSTPSNLWMTNNTIGPIDDAGGFRDDTIIVFPGNGQLAGLNMSNNIFPLGESENSIFGAYGQYEACAEPLAGACSHPQAPLPLSAVMAPIPTIQSAAGYTDGAPGAGMQGVSIISGGTGYTNGGSLSFTNCSINPVGTYGVVTGTITSTIPMTSFGVCLSSAMTVGASGGTGAVLRPHYGLTPNYTWGGNYGFCTQYQYGEATAADCAYTSSFMPSTDYYAYGNTTSSRAITVGLANVANGDLRCTATSFQSCYAGANFAKLEGDLGLTSQISVQASSTSLAFNYVSPDSTGCFVDISTNGVNWTRESDSGGVRSRSLVFNGLATSTVYQYRILCYTEQDPTTWLEYPEDTSNLTTDGTVSTLAATVKPVPFAFNLANFSGATAYVATMTAPDGAVYTSSGTVSPITVSVPAGDYSTVFSYVKNSTAITKSDQQIVSVR